MPPINLSNWNDIHQLIYWSIGVLVVLFIVFSAWKWAYGQFLKPIHQFFEDFTAINNRVQDMWQGWQPNGGTSMADRLCRIESSVCRLTAIVSSEAEASPNPRVEFKLGGSLETANQAALRLLGMELNEARGLGWLQAITPLMQESVLEQLATAEKNRLPMRRHVVLQTNARQKEGKDGVSALLSLFPLTDSHGEAAGFWGVLERIESPLTA